MPFLGDDQRTSVAAQQWQIALRNAVRRRVQADELVAVLPELASRYPASSNEISSILMGFRARAGGLDEQLLFNYARVFVRQKLVRIDSLLQALLDTSPVVQPEPSVLESKPRSGFPTCEDRIFNMALQMYSAEEVIFRTADARGLALVLTRWMHAVAAYETSKQLEGDVLHTVDVFSYGTYEAIASLALTIFSHQAMRGVVKQPWWKQRRAAIVTTMESFDANVLQWMQSQVAGRLRMLTSLPPLIDTDSNGRPLYSDQQILQMISDIPALNTRAGVFIWLNACLCSRPLTNDLSMLTYLHTRYSGDYQPLAVDLLIASFDVLTAALLRKEPEQQVHLTRSFICNKIPHLLSLIAGFLVPPVTVETCVHMAFMSITMDALPPISAGATDVREKLRLTRLECLQACALHTLVSEHTIASILQEPPIALARATRHTKDGLLLQSTNNIARLEPLIEELDGMLGNAGAIAGCIVETIGSLCMSKDTMSLKTLCNMLIKRFAVVDIIMQYSHPSDMLLPLCTQLNDWVHDADQTEFTPAYEEFASILLFTLAVVHRYDLTRADIGLPEGASFVGNLLKDKSISKLPRDLTDDQSGQLSKWIEGLYATDEHGESSGISDEVMRQCPPQAFYQLVPTLFEQSVFACKSGTLSAETFKGGLELLVEPFLLPSLIGGLSWLVQHSWTDRDDADILLQVLEKLLKPTSSSQEMKAMHKIVLAIVAQDLYTSLQVLADRQPNRKGVSNLLEVVKPYVTWRRTMECSKAELDDWVSTPDGGISRCIRVAIQDQVSWLSNVGPTPPPRYTHRLFTTACDEVGTKAVLDAVVAELIEQTKLGNGPLALDICTALICAPTVRSKPAIMGVGAATAAMDGSPSTVREALRLTISDVQDLLQKPSHSVEALVRLARRVERQLAISQLPQISMPAPLHDQAADQVMAELGLTDGTLVADSTLDQVAQLGAASSADFSSNDLTAALDQSIDLSNQVAHDMAAMSSETATMSMDPSQDIFNDLNISLDQSSQQMLHSRRASMAMGMNEGGGNAEDDIFAGLDMGGLNDDFNFT